MAKIFISYRRDDAGGHAARLHDKLSEEFGADAVFMDLSDILAGDDFEHTIRNNLEDAEVALIVIGKQWATVEDDQGRRRLTDPGDYVVFEVRTALKQARHVIPVLVGGASVPRKSDLPADLRPLVSRHAFDLSPARWDYDSSQLTGLIHRYIDVIHPPAIIRSVAAGFMALLISALLWWTNFFTLLPLYSGAQDGLYLWLAQFAPSSLAEELALVEESTVGPNAGADARRDLRRHNATVIRGLAEAGVRVIAFDYHYEDNSDADAEFAGAVAAAAPGTAVVLGVRKLLQNPSTLKMQPDLALHLRPAVDDSWGLIELAVRPSAWLYQIQVGELLQDPQRIDPAEVAPSLPVRTVMRYLDASKSVFDMSSAGVQLINDRGEIVKSLSVRRSDKRLSVAVAAPQRRELDRRRQAYPDVLQKCQSVAEGGPAREADLDSLRRQFGGKIVMIGSAQDRPAGFGELRGYELQAQVTSSILRGDYLQIADLRAGVAVLAGFVLLGLLWWHRYSPRAGQISLIKLRQQAWLRSGLVFGVGLVAAAILCQVIAVLLVRVEGWLLPTFYCLAAYSLAYILRANLERVTPGVKV